MRLIEKIKLDNLRQISILGLPIIKYSKKNNSIESLSIFPRSTILKIVSKKYKTLLTEKDFDAVYYVWNNTGETWQFFRVAKSCFKKNNSKKPIIITDKPYHNDLIKMLLPNVLHVRTKITLEERFFIEKNYKKIFQKQTFLIFPMSHFLSLEEKLQQGEDIHFFDAILKSLDFKNSEIEITKPVISKEAEASALKKAKVMNLDINNFVFISPEAKSNRTLSEDFWQKLCNSLKNLGYDTYFNIVGSLNTISTHERKCEKLSIEEALALAKYSKAIMGLRSGFMEILAALNKPMFCLYTGFRQRLTPAMSANKVLKGFSLKKCLYENSDRFYEYDADKFPERALMKQLIEDFLNCVDCQASRRGVNDNL